MIDLYQVRTEWFVRKLKRAYHHEYGGLESQYASVLEWTGRMALEAIGNSDALYHNVEHTIMVALAGQAILSGKLLIEGDVDPRDYLHFMMAALCHDVGYVRGICKQDRPGVIATGVAEAVVELPETGSDAALTPYHVDRSKQFVRERFSGRPLVGIDSRIIADCIEMTRFPVPPGDAHKDTRGLGGLLRAADLIGQLGDPNYLRKIPALYYEFAEVGVLERIGYTSPGQMRKRYASFYWQVVRQYVEDALKYLNVTNQGKQWVANLHAHVFEVEHGAP